MASKPTEKFMFMIDSFDVLDEIKEQLAIKACEGKVHCLCMLYFSMINMSAMTHHSYTG